MSKILSKLHPEDIETYREMASEAIDRNCIICDKTIGFQDWQSFKVDHNEQERAVFFCTKCYRILRAEK